MSKSVYLKIIGVIEIILSIVGLIILLVNIIKLSSGLDELSGDAKAAALPPIIINWILFVFAVFTGPSLGILFLTVASHEEEVVSNAAARTTSSISTNHPSKISELQNRVNTLERKVIVLEQSSAVKQTPKSEGPLADFSEKNKEKLKKQMLEETIDEKEAKVESADKPVVTGKDKDDYALDERVVFNQDFSTNGIDIKKGDTGIIDNRLLNSGGRIYVVILDKTKDIVKVSGVNFE